MEMQKHLCEWLITIRETYLLVRFCHIPKKNITHFLDIKYLCNIETKQYRDSYTE